MKWTEQTSPISYGKSIDECEAFLKTNCTCTYHLSLVNVYIAHLHSGKPDHACIKLNRLRKAGLCS